jgi:hypothetical protein
MNDTSTNTSSNFQKPPNQIQGSLPLFNSPTFSGSQDDGTVPILSNEGTVAILSNY